MIMTLMSTPMQEEHSETESAAYNRWKKSPALVLAVPAVLTYTRTSPKGPEDAYGKWQPSRTVEEPVSKASAASESSAGATAGTDHRPTDRPSAVALGGGRDGTPQNHAGAGAAGRTRPTVRWSDPQPPRQVRNKQELLRQTFSFEHHGNTCSAGDHRQSALKQSYQLPAAAEPQIESPRRVDRVRRQALYQSSISLGDM
jgi:hypothetical protein